MTINNPPAPPKPALVRTALPLPPQEQSPAEVQAALDEAAARHAETAAALAAAQQAFDEADRQREFALSEEEKRRALEEQAHIDDLRRVLPQTEDDADRHRRLFREACASENEEPIDMTRVLDAFVQWGRFRETAHRMRQQILAHDAQQSRDDYESWVRRVHGWNELLRSVQPWHQGGTLGGADTDLDGLAKVNARIAEESQEAPRQLHRDATDVTTPFIEDLGLRDPHVAAADQVFAAPLHALDFGDEFSAAVDEDSKDWSRTALSSLRAQRANGDRR